MEHGSRCQPDCDCKVGDLQVTMPDGTRARVDPASGTGLRLCWGVSGAEASVAAAGVIGLTITLVNYSWLRPRVLRISSATAVGAANDPNATNTAPLIQFSSIASLGRNVLGSATVGGAFLDVYADRGLMFGKDISPITSSNTITLAGTNNSGTTSRIAVAVEGVAAQ